MEPHHPTGVVKTLRSREGRAVHDAPEAEEHSGVVKVDAEHEHVERDEELERLLQRLQGAVMGLFRALVRQDPKGGANISATVVMS